MKKVLSVTVGQSKLFIPFDKIIKKDCFLTFVTFDTNLIALEVAKFFIDELILKFYSKREDTLFFKLIESEVD